MASPGAGTIIAALAIATLAAGCASFRAERDVLRLNDELLQAIRKHDTASLLQLAAPDFWSGGYDGRMNRKQWCDAIAEGKFTAANRASTSVVIEAPDRVNVCGEHHPRSGGEVAFCDEWVKRDGRWQLVSSLPQVELL